MEVGQCILFNEIKYPETSGFDFDVVYLDNNIAKISGNCSCH